MTVIATTHPAVFVGTEEEETHDAPVASVPGHVVLAVKLDEVTPAEAIERTNNVTLLLVAMQLDAVAEAQLADQEAPRTMA